VQSRWTSPSSSAYQPPPLAQRGPPPSTAGAARRGLAFLRHRRSAAHLHLPPATPIVPLPSSVVGAARPSAPGAAQPHLPRGLEADTSGIPPVATEREEREVRKKIRK